MKLEEFQNPERFKFDVAWHKMDNFNRFWTKFKTKWTTTAKDCQKSRYTR